MVPFSWLLPLVSVFLLGSGDHLLQTATAQQSNPAGAAEMAYASVQDTTLYMQGGFNTNFTDVFYSLDLTQRNWSIFSPPWKSLPAPSIKTDANPRATISNGMTLSKDQTRLILWAEPGVFVYDIAAGSWTNKTVDSLAGSVPLWFNYRRAATHGETGLVYIPGGASAGTKMVVMNPDTFEAQTVDMPPPNLLNGTISLYGWIWSDIRKSFLLTCGEFVGQNGAFIGQNSDKSFEFFPGNNTWAPLVTGGTKLPAISRHCMVQGYGGRKVVLYGGHEWVLGAEELRGMIYVLDVPTMTWTAGELVNPNFVSADSACTITGSKFISWGGSKVQLNKDILRTPVIFDVDKMQWMQSISTTPSASSPSASSPSSSSTLSDPNTSNNTVAIAVGCSGAVVVLGLAGLVFWMRQRRRKAAYASVATVPTRTDTAGGTTEPGRPPQLLDPYRNNSNVHQDFYKNEGLGAEGVSGVYGDYQDRHSSPFNVRDSRTVHTIPVRNPHQVAGENMYHEFPNDNIHRNPQTTPDTFY